MAFQYHEYAALFNKGDDVKLIDKYFDDNVVFTGSSGPLRGREALLKFLFWVFISDAFRIDPAGSQRRSRMYATSKGDTQRKGYFRRSGYGFSLFSCPR